MTEHVPILGEGAEAAASMLIVFQSEKEWLLYGLRRNRFRRGLAADYLGLSRKTLYNKMRAHGLLPVSGQGARAIGDG
jgi:DNA-binding NtrC family response regulator